MKSLKFYDLKAKKSFMSSKYTKITKSNKKGRTITMAKTKAPSGIMSYRILSNKK